MGIKCFLPSSRNFISMFSRSRGMSRSPIAFPISLYYLAAIRATPRVILPQESKMAPLVRLCYNESICIEFLTRSLLEMLSAFQLQH